MSLVSLARSDARPKSIESACDESCHVWLKIETDETMIQAAEILLDLGFFFFHKLLYLGSNSRKFCNQPLYVVYASSRSITQTVVYNQIV